MSLGIDVHMDVAVSVSVINPRGEAAVIGLLTGNGYDRQSVVKPEEIRSLTELERLVGKKTFASLCGDYIEKPKGKPTLVPVSDKRPEINTAEDDFRDID